MYLVHDRMNIRRVVQRRARGYLRQPTRVHSREAVTRPSDSVHHIAVLRSIGEFSWDNIKQVAALLSAAFYEDEEAWNRGTANAREPPLAGALFGWASLFAVLTQHVVYGNNYLTLLASENEKVVGCCGLSFDSAPDDVTAATGLAAGSQYGLLTGLAVAHAHRRCGVASKLLAAAAAATAARLPPPAMLALLVARTNTPALRLYVRQGFEEQPDWVDARWQAEAEKGKVGKPRRLLLVRLLSS
ncbi:hypothetical protein Vretimale_10643 [Volvox reticuliferus]|uniref:N-acetyltransferase domain-containing protein n=1 Tax=Volvox reticuliferus TaxID=1737510 RepID=A0A8J4CRR1_9CHLO|nr:hypothetical protein Vretifemale_13818 [Volvox reticuliferus]GIM06362.1 hypothetical protein Vretimale_10643 [Volvox reticuliferus]